MRTKTIKALAPMYARTSTDGAGNGCSGAGLQSWPRETLLWTL